MQELFDRVEAVNAVFTRARLRAAVSAGEVSLSLCDIWVLHGCINGPTQLTWTCVCADG